MKYLAGSEYFDKLVDAESDPTPHSCPVCAETEFSEGGSYEICEVCNWEDDPVQLSEPDLATGANHMSLTEARQIWAETGKPIK